MHLWHFAVRAGAREKRLVARVAENMQHSVFEGWIGGVTVRLPISIGEIELDVATNWFAPVQADSRVAEIRSRFAIPNAKLDDVDLVSVGRDKLFSKISGKPARLQFELARNSLRRKQRPLTHARGHAHLRVPICILFICHIERKPCPERSRMGRDNSHR